MSVDLRPPLLARIYSFAFLALWIAACLFGVVKALPRFTAVIPLLMLIGGSLFCWRVATVMARGQGQTLLVRNIYRTHRIPASEVTAIRTGRSPMQPFGHTVFVDTSNDVIALDVGAIGKLRGGAERDRACLEAWLTTVRGSAASS